MIAVCPSNSMQVVPPSRPSRSRRYRWRIPAVGRWAGSWARAGVLGRRPRGLQTPETSSPMVSATRPKPGCLAPDSARTRHISRLIHAARPRQSGIRSVLLRGKETAHAFHRRVTARGRSDAPRPLDDRNSGIGTHRDDPARGSAYLPSRLRVFRVALHSDPRGRRWPASSGTLSEA